MITEENLAEHYSHLEQVYKKALNDVEWQTVLRSFLPQELAALRQAHSNLEPAVRLMKETLTEIHHGTLLASNLIGPRLRLDAAAN